MMESFFLLFSLSLFYSFSNFVDCSKIINVPADNLAGENLNDGNYEIIQFWYNDVDTENGRGLRIKRSDTSETLYINECPIIREKLPVWLVYNATTIVKADENIISDAIRIYQHPELVLSLASSFDEHNHRYFTGSISKKTIAPLSNRTVASILQEKPHLFEKTLEPGTVDQANNLTLSGYHVIYEPKRDKAQNLILPPLGTPELFKKSTGESNATNQDRSKRSTPHTVYPEILAILDYGERYTSIYEVRFLDLLAYTINFWNAVNLRYKSLSDPRVQLRITGIVVSMSRWALPPIDLGYGSRGLLVQRVLVTMSDWLQGRIPKIYDIAVTHTNLPLCLFSDPECVRNILGLAVYPAVCRREDGLPLSAIVYDRLNYKGVQAAVHEIGHILGAAHDDLTENDCPETDGYIMAETQDFADHKFSWSSCSHRDLSNFLKSSVTNCYHNQEPSEDQGNLVEILTLPGSTVSLEQQCEDRYYGAPCRSDNLCQSLYCKTFIFFCGNSGPALDGTPCLFGECRMGVCLPKLSNLTSNLVKPVPLAYVDPYIRDIQEIVVP